MLECANAPGMDDRCEAMARLGRCDTDRSLLDTCKLSCTRCAPLPSNISGTFSDFVQLCAPCRCRSLCCSFKGHPLIPTPQLCMGARMRKESVGEMRKRQNEDNREREMFPRDGHVLALLPKCIPAIPATSLGNGERLGHSCSWPNFQSIETCTLSTLLQRWVAR